MHSRAWNEKQLRSQLKVEPKNPMLASKATEAASKATEADQANLQDEVAALM